MMAATPAVRPFVPRDAGNEAAASPLLGRATARLQLDDVALTARFVADSLQEVRSASRGEALARLGWTLDGVPGELLLPAGLVAGLIAPLEEVPDGALDWTTAPMLLELLLARHLDQAEALLGHAIQLRSLERDGTAAADRRVGVAIRGAADGAPFAAWLSMAPNALGAVARLMRLLPRDAPRVPDPPVVIAARVGLARLGAAALAAARVGDALVMENGPLQRGRVMIVVGESRVATASWKDNMATLTEPPRAAGAFTAEGWTMQGGQEGDPVDATFGDLRVTLVFELGRRLATLAEVRELAAGQVLDLGRDDTSPVDILANGARLGRGEIVRVGDALAVRITGLHGRD